MNTIRMRAMGWGVVMLALGALSVHGALIAYDDFESYTAESQLHGGAGGSGWTDAWSVATGKEGTTLIDHGAIPGRGNGVVVNDENGTNPLFWRSFPAQTDTPIYIGFLLRRGDAMSSAVILQFFADNGGGLSASGSGGIWTSYQFFVRTKGDGAVTSTTVAQADQPYQVVLKFSKTSTPGNYDRVDLYINQHLEGTASLTTTASLDTDTLSRFALRTWFDGGAGGAIGPAYIDEVRVASSYAAALAPATYTPDATAALVEDVYVESNNPDSVFNTGDGGRGFWARNHSVVTRVGFVQFTLPQITGGRVVEKAVLSGVGFSAQNETEPPVVAGLSVNPTLSTLTWNGAVGADIITGRHASLYHPLWGSAATLFPETFPPQSIQRGTTRMEGTDPDDGFLKFINDNISSSGPVTVTFAVGGPVLAVYAATSFEWYNRETVDGLYAGVWAPRLELVYNVLPKGTVIMIR